MVPMALQARLPLELRVGPAAQEPMVVGCLVVSLNLLAAAAAVVLLDLPCEKTAKQ